MSDVLAFQYISRAVLAYDGNKDIAVRSPAISAMDGFHRDGAPVRSSKSLAAQCWHLPSALHARARSLRLAWLLRWSLTL